MTTTQKRGLDLAFVRTWFERYWLAVWFGVIFTIRLSSLITGDPGFDARIYLAATTAWLGGGDPWLFVDVQQFAAPPPSMIPLAPFALLPEDVGIATLMVLAVVGVVATVRLLRLPWWWLLFPPFLDGVWSGNPQTLLVPLILVGAGPVAAFLKVYALVPMVLTLRWRAVAVTAGLLLVTAPFLPWASYLQRFGELSATLARQSDGGLSATVLPWLIPIGLVAVLLCGRERAAWLAVPVLWPSTQAYYATLAVPGLTAAGAALMALPIPGAAVAAALVIAIQMRHWSLPRLREAWLPARNGTSTSS